MIGLNDAGIEVQFIATIQPVILAKAKTPEYLGYPPDFFEKTAGRFQDEPLVQYPQGQLQERNWDDLFTRH